MTISTIPRKYIIVSDSKPVSPFEGMLWVDTSSGNETKQYKGGEWNSLNINVAPLRSKILELINDVALNNYSNSLSQNNYDDVFYDIFTDSSKISSSSNLNLTTGTDGEIKIAEQSSINSVNTQEKNYGQTNSCSFTVDISTRGYISDVRVELDWSDENLSVSIKDDSNNTLAQDSNVFNNTGIKGFSFSESDYSRVPKNETLTVEISTSGKLLTGSTTPTINKENITVSGNEYPTYYNEGNFTFLEFQESAFLDGNLTTTNKNLSFSPDKILLNQVVNISTNTDIIYKLYDSSDNLIKTINQIDVNKELSISTADTTFYLEIDLTNTDSLSVSTLYEYGILFV